jgi:hypothetical protein
MRTLFLLVGVKLLAWNTIQREKKKIRCMLGIDVVKSISTFGVPTYALSVPSILA